MLRSQVQRHLRRKRRCSLRELIHFSHPRLVDKPSPVHFCLETKANSSCQDGRITALRRKKKWYFYNLLQLSKPFHIFGGSQPPEKQILLLLPQGLRVQAHMYRREAGWYMCANPDSGTRLLRFQSQPHLMILSPPDD